jgi:hypothetical protein
MKVPALEFLFLSLAATMHSVQALFGSEGSVCSQAIGGVATCVALYCPEQTGACDSELLDAVTCDDVEAMCHDVWNCCADQCATEIENLGACVPGVECNVDCYGESEDEDESEDESDDEDEEDEIDLDEYEDAYEEDEDEDYEVEIPIVQE